VPAGILAPDTARYMLMPLHGFTSHRYGLILEFYLKGIFNTDFYHIILLFVNLHSDFGTYMNANTFTQKERKHLDDLLKKL
jgi:hypothetical protein